MTEFALEVWGLHRPSAAATEIGEFTQFADLSVRIPLNDSREARVKVSMHDPLVETLAPLQQSLKVYYRGALVHWAPFTFEEDYTDGTLTLISVDSLRLQHHYLRYGDAALNHPTIDEEGDLHIDHRGMRLVRDAADNTTEQDDRDVPSLGIADGFESPLRTRTIGVERGQECWAVMKEISSHVSGPDFELWPTNSEPGHYCKLDCYSDQGSDITGTVRFFYGVAGEDDNVAGVRHMPGQPITHAHAIDSEVKYRETAADTGSSYAQGIYVAWLPTDYKIRDGNTEVLFEWADAKVRAYRYPPKQIDLTLRPDAGQSRFYLADYMVGDRVHVEAVKGHRELAGTFRIREVELTRPGTRGPDTTKLAVVPTVGSAGVYEES